MSPTVRPSRAVPQASPALAGEGRWGIVKERYPRCMQAANAILADGTASQSR
jgi:hypothetical protein